MTTGPSRRPPPRQHGFTLLELCVVAGLLAVLTGIGVGFLRRGDSGRGAMLSMLAGQLRSAALTAQSRGLPTEVRIEPGVPGGAARVRSRELVPITVFHLEPEDRTFAPVLRPEVHGVDVPQGRFGHARRNQDGDKAPLLSLKTEPVDFDVSDGFVFRLDLLLEQHQAATVLRLGRGFEIELDARGHVRVRLVQRGDGGQSGGTALLETAAALPFGRWCNLEVVHDGAELWCAVDGQELGRVAAGAPLLQQRGDELQLSPGDAPVAGLLDEVQWLAYGWTEPLLLPLGYAVPAECRVHFDAAGDVVGEPVLQIKDLQTDVTEQFPVKRGGVIE